MPDHHYRRLVDGDIVKVKIQNIFMILFDFEEYSCGGHHFGVRLFASWRIATVKIEDPRILFDFKEYSEKLKHVVNFFWHLLPAAVAETQLRII